MNQKKETKTNGKKNELIKSTWKRQKKKKKKRERKKKETLHRASHMVLSFNYA